MLDPAISELAVSMVVEGTGGTYGTRGEGTGAVVARAGGARASGSSMCSVVGGWSSGGISAVGWSSAGFEGGR